MWVLNKSPILSEMINDKSSPDLSLIGLTIWQVTGKTNPKWIL